MEKIARAHEFVLSLKLTVNLTGGVSSYLLNARYLHDSNDD
jgi:hypothetical protein